METVQKNSRIVVTLLLLACIIFLSGALALYFMRQQEIEKRISIQKELDAVTQEKTRIAKKLEETTIVKEDLEKKVDNLEEKVGFAEQQLAEEKKQRDSLFSRLEGEKKESKRLIEELLKLKNEHEQVTADLDNVKVESEQLKTQLYSIQQAKEILENKLKEVLSKSEVELEKIVVKPSSMPAVQDTGGIFNTANPPPVSKKGEVLVVNKKFDFVIIGLGEEDGLNIGRNVDIYRDSQFIATLNVEKVHANMAAAKITPEFKNTDIREGDEVIIK